MFKSDSRLDRVLQEMTGLSRKKTKQLLDAGRISVNGRKVVIASWEVKRGDQIKIIDKGKEVLPPADREFLKVVHEDADLLVVEKRAGIPCEVSPLSMRPTLVSIINAYLHRREPHLKHHYLGLVHRLDQETSGLMVYTKRKEANKITDQFKRHAVKRRYVAVVRGRIEETKGRLEAYLKKSNLLKGGRKVTLASPEAGRRAITEFHVLERYPNATLVELELNTGRTHQIRVQTAAMGHPVIGDKIYGNIPPHPPLNLRGGWGGIQFSRQALHACYLKFHHPVTGKKMEFKSELPRDMRRLVNRLRLNV